MSLTKEDYIKILDFYKKEIPSTFKEIKAESEKILANKLCKCIKKLDTTYEAKSIGICTRSIFNSKKLTRGKFKCKGNNIFVKFNNNTTKKKKAKKRKTNKKKSKKNKKKSKKRKTNKRR